MLKRVLLLSFLLILSCNPTDYSKIKVIDVIDGDTVRLSNGKLLRYVGIDTAEVRQKVNGKFIYNPQPFSLEAKEYNRKLVEGKPVRIEFDITKTDRYGRLLGYCYVDDTFVNAKLIEQGYAVLYTFPPNIKYTDLFADLQRKARNQRKGIWASYQVIDQAQAADHIGQIRTVQGKVVNTYQSPKVTYLNFGNDYKTDFTIVIFKNSLAQFHKKNIDPANFYRNKTVQVTGRIKSYNGPEIIVNTPAEIEVLE